MTAGMSATKGTEIDRRRHISQSIEDILTTPVGSRVMRRDYGSRLVDLLDTPANRAGEAALIAATADALARWEPRVDLNIVRVLTKRNGATVLGLTLTVRSDGRPMTYEVRIAGDGYERTV